MRSELKTYGFEIEAEWTEEARTAIASYGGKFVGDGSIHICEQHYENDRQDDDETRLEEREFNSPVFEYRNAEHTDKVRSLFEKLQKLYDADKFHFNDSCGFHIHTGYRTKKPPEIMSKQFADYFLKKLKETYPKEWDKRSENTYCQTYEYDDEEIAYPSERYRAINYCAIQKHGTIEFRFFPMNTPLKLYEYIRFVLKTINEFMDTKLENHNRIDITRLLKPKVAQMLGKVSIQEMLASISRESEIGEIIEKRRLEREERKLKRSGYRASLR